MRPNRSTVRPCGARHRRVPGHRPRDRRGAPRRRRQRRRLRAAIRATSTRRAGSCRAAGDRAARRPGGRRQREGCGRAPSTGAIATFGGLDILINNAGVGVFANVADMEAAAWHQVIDTNLSGVFFCCHAAIPAMRQRGGGWIINISSLAGTNPFKSAAAYCASKAGLNAFTEALMLEVRYDDIRVSCVVPGSVATGFGAWRRGAGRLEARARGRRAGRARSDRASRPQPAEPRRDPAVEAAEALTP